MLRNFLGSCIAAFIFAGQSAAQAQQPHTIDYRIDATRTHHKFSSAIPPVLRVPSGSVIEVQTNDATGGQLKLGSDVKALRAVNWDLTHSLTGPVYIEDARPGDILAVTLLALEPGDWGWTGIWDDFGVLKGEEKTLAIKTYRIDRNRNLVQFSEGIEIPLTPFAGVMGVAPATREMLDTVPPRANGGNMDDPNITVGTTVYFPVFVQGALFSIGDAHAVQGHGEVGGSAVEVPMRIVYRVQVLKGHRKIAEPQYENANIYAATAFAKTLDEAAKKATRYMLDYLEAERGMKRSDAYMLCSLACDLKIAQVVDEPHVLISMHLRKDIFAGADQP